MRQREIQALETHLRTVPEDARARTLLAGDYASLGMVEDGGARGAARDLAAPERGDRALQRRLRLLQLGKRAEAVAAIQKAWDAGFRDPDWARRDPDLALIHGDPEFERLYPAAH